jgi:hypothetical protein
MVGCGAGEENVDGAETSGALLLAPERPRSAARAFARKPIRVTKKMGSGTSSIAVKARTSTVLTRSTTWTAVARR